MINKAISGPTELFPCERSVSTDLMQDGIP